MNSGGSTTYPTALDIAILQEFVGADPARLRDLLETFDGTARETAHLLRAAIHAARSDDATAAAHKLKSSARMVGALPLGELCEQMETAGSEGHLAKLVQLLPRFDVEMAAVLLALTRTIISLPAPSELASR